jgi:hypothetical protein
MPNDVMLSVTNEPFMLNVVMLNVVMPNVVAPFHSGRLKSYPHLLN